MVPGDFPERTAVLGRPVSMSQEECSPLAVYQDVAGGYTVSHWRMTWRERVSALLFGRVWVWIHMGGHTQPPIALEAKRSIFIRPGLLTRIFQKLCGKA